MYMYRAFDVIFCQSTTLMESVASELSTVYYHGMRARQLRAVYCLLPRHESTALANGLLFVAVFLPDVGTLPVLTRYVLVLPQHRLHVLAAIFDVKHLHQKPCGRHTLKSQFHISLFQQLTCMRVRKKQSY